MIIVEYLLEHNVLAVIATFISLFLIKKYVFLEPEMEPKKRRIFYFAGTICIAISYVLGGVDTAAMAIFLVIVADIVISRKKQKIIGALLLIPMCGIINGIMIPTITVPLVVLNLSDSQAIYYTLAVYGIYGGLLLIFYLKGKKWRKWFEKNIKSRYVHGWEKILLCVIGSLMMIFLNTISGNINLVSLAKLKDNTFVSIETSTYSGDIFIYAMIAFILTITLIVLIMQGNKRSAYQEQVLDMQFNTIVTMADLVESRDENTGGHTKRTARYVEIIAKQLKKDNKFSNILTKQYIQDMVVAAPLHDIGKIHIPDAILNKPGRLTEEEFTIMKTHTEVGRDLLKNTVGYMGNSNYLNIAIDMAAYHHEWCNGKGYPEGLTRDEIPLCAKIMAVADVFDALISKRCYKESMPVEKAYEIIRGETGTHFDEEVVEAFFASKDKMEEVFS